MVIKKRPSLQDFDAVAAVVDKHTGKVIGQFSGLGAEEDASHFARSCASGGVQHMSSTAIITGEEAKKAIRKGRT